MKCAICKHGETQTGFTTIVLEKNETILVFKQVPAQICDNCGEEYISSQTNKGILEKAKHEINKGSDNRYPVAHHRAFFSKPV